MTERGQVLEVRETLTPADHQTHRRYTFQVPADCLELQIHVRYAPVGPLRPPPRPGR